MKRFISVLSVTAIIICSLSVVAFAGETEKAATNELLSQFEVYDSDCDGVPATTADARETLKIALGVKAPAESKEYDVDGDGLVDSRDALAILRAALGIEDIFSHITKEQAVEYLCAELSLVKTAYPGFYRTRTEQCTDNKVTVSGWPFKLGEFNVTNMDYIEYLKLVKAKYEELNDNGSLDDEIAQMDSYIAQAEKLMQPTVTKRNVTAGSSVNHHNQFPVNGYKWACRLSADDVKNFEISYDNGEITVAVYLKDYTYSADEYPFKSSEKDLRAALPYGKVFAKLPSSSSVPEGLKSIELKNGSVVIKVDASSGMPTSAYFYYDYKNTTYQENKMDLFTIKTTSQITSKLEESYKIYAID